MAPHAALAQTVDFAHPASPHREGFSPVGGLRDRPMLVINTQFTDRAVPPEQTEAWVAQTFFGPAYPNVADYFSSTSYGNLILTAATEASGAPGNGVVTVNAGTFADYAMPAFETDGERRLERRNRISLELADSAVDYSQFDTDFDGVVTSLELLVVNMHTGDSSECAATRGHESVRLDGVWLELRMPMVPSGDRVGLFNHEAAHALMNIRDLYGFPVGWTAMGGAGICDTGVDQLVHANAWEKIHLGWLTPTVVTRDGYYLVNRADTHPQAFVLYDPAKGPEHYFTVENRTQTAGSYDSWVPDRGLLITRVDDRDFFSNTTPINAVMWPFDSTTAPSGGEWMWDPSDSVTPQREMDGRLWGDGTPARVAVRAIHPAGDSIKAYFDVPGPGVLIDCLDLGTPSRVATFTGERTTAITLPVMNTGDAAGTFDFTVEGLPSGWSATQDFSHALNAAQRGTTRISLGIPPTTPAGIYELTARARWTSDTSYQTSCYFNVDVRGPRYGHVWAHDPAATFYTPSAAYQVNTTGATNTITRTATGVYVVRFPGLGNAGGVAHVSPYGTAGNICQVGAFNQDSSDEVVEVRCFDPAGVPVNTQFLATYSRPHFAETFGSVFASQPSTASYTPPAISQHNTTNALNSITRSGTGVYAVTMPGLTGTGGNVQVTAWGPFAARCQVANWGPTGTGQVVNVRCFNSAGAAADAFFVASYIRGAGLSGNTARRSAYLWAGAPTASSYTPDPTYQFNSTGGVNTMQRTGIGLYVATMPGVGATNPFSPDDGHVTVTPYGGTGRRCRVVSFGAGFGGSDLRATVQCETYSGTPADTAFSLTYSQ